MKKDLINRERRLRRQAEKKDLHIQKQTCEPITGYLISKENSPLVITGYDRFNNLLTIEEAEAFVEEYEAD